MGKKINAQNDPDSQYLKAVNGMCDVALQRMLKPWLNNELFWKISSQSRQEKKYLKVLHGFTEKVIKERKEERKLNYANKSLSQDQNTEKDEENTSFYTSKKIKLAFLDLLLDTSEDGKVLSDEDIREETDTFMFEGHDTTAASLSWTLYLLGENLDCQKKLHEEIDSVFKGDKNRPVTITDLGKLKYLESCIKESLRIFPSVPWFGRVLREDLVLGDGNILPKGLQFSVFAYFIHRDPIEYPQPEKFIPERFNLENSNKRNPYAYVPFSAGVRNCIGQKFAMLEEKIVLAHIFRRFSIESVDKREELKVCPDLILKSKNGINIKLKER